MGGATARIKSISGAFSCSTLEYLKTNAACWLPEDLSCSQNSILGLSQLQQVRLLGQVEAMCFGLGRFTIG